jgi:hypothetical protein
MEIRCSSCRAVTLARIEPVYDGFKKIGETYICTACGARHSADDAALFVSDAPTRPSVFTDDDKPKAPSIFSDDERRKSCSWCTHFVVNPFNQRCGLTNRETQATDLCVRFQRREDCTHT